MQRPFTIISRSPTRRRSSTTTSTIGTTQQSAPASHDGKGQIIPPLSLPPLFKPHPFPNGPALSLTNGPTAGLSRARPHRWLAAAAAATRTPSCPPRARTHLHPSRIASPDYSFPSPTLLLHFASPPPTPRLYSCQARRGLRGRCSLPGGAAALGLGALRAAGSRGLLRGPS
jgi:hypothetical protein